MASIYIHIPFCKQACHYCNFHFSTSPRLTNDFLEALLKEIVLQKDYLEQESVDTIYFGGGTPSLFSPGQLYRIMDQLHRHFSVTAGAELTLEANPDDIIDEKLHAWKQAGINRLSVGIQSFFEEDLRWMNRAHSAAQAVRGIPAAQDAGFDNLTIDLIYGVPGLTDDRWEQNVQRAISYGIPHLSCYALTVETGTALDSFIRKNKVHPVNADDQARQFLLLMNWLRSAGYEHYEISNFALPGQRSRHNTAYWQGKKYVGLGPSAHSFNGAERQWNVAHNTRYIQSLQRGELPFEKEVLTPAQQMNEYTMTSLRTIEGIDLQYVQHRFGENNSRLLKQGSRRSIETALMENLNERLILTQQGKLFADGIASDLFVTETGVVNKIADHAGKTSDIHKI